MAFALIYETSDWAYIGGSLTAADAASIPVADRNLARKYWQGGLNQWANAPAYTGDAACPLCRIVVVNFGTLAEFVALCRRVADAIALPNAGDTRYLLALAADMELTGIEPWP